MEATLTPEAITAIAKEISLQMRLSSTGTPLYIRQADAYRRYTRARVERWAASGKVRMSDSGNKHDYRFEDLERCAIAEEYTHGVIAKRKYNKTINN